MKVLDGSVWSLCPLFPMFLTSRLSQCSKHVYVWRVVEFTARPVSLPNEYTSFYKSSRGCGRLDGNCIRQWFSNDGILFRARSFVMYNVTKIYLFLKYYSFSLLETELFQADVWNHSECCYFILNTADHHPFLIFFYNVEFKNTFLTVWNIKYVE